MQCSKKRKLVVSYLFIQTKVCFVIYKSFSGKFLNIKTYQYTCDLNIDVNHNVHSNNCSLLYFGRFLAENNLSINVKVHFSRWRVRHYGILPVRNRSILMYYLKLTSCIKLKNQKIKTLNVSSVMENYLKMNEEKFGLSVSAVFCRGTWTLSAQRTQNISMTFINRLETENGFSIVLKM